MADGRHDVGATEPSRRRTRSSAPRCCRGASPRARLPLGQAQHVGVPGARLLRPMWLRHLRPRDRFPAGTHQPPDAEGSVTRRLVNTHIRSGPLSWESTLRPGRTSVNSWVEAEWICQGQIEEHASDGSAVRGSGPNLDFRHEVMRIAIPRQCLGTPRWGRLEQVRLGASGLAVPAVATTRTRHGRRLAIRPLRRARWRARPTPPGMPTVSRRNLRETAALVSSRRSRRCPRLGRS